MKTPGSSHAPVLVAETVALLAPLPTASVIDATAGAGGHTRALLAAGVARVLSIDVDPAAVAALRRRWQGEARVHAVQANFRDLESVAGRTGFTAADAVLFDLGMSSDQLDDPDRGLSFRAAGPLDMRLNPGAGQPAATLVNHLPERDLAELLRTYGEERRAGRIAHRIVQRRPVASTAELAAIVAGALPGRHRIHPATRTFQALRIATNDELDALDAGLDAARTVARPGARVAVIAFHSLEDRIVKTRFRTWAREFGAEVLTRRPVRPSAPEVEQNRRARSGRLRVVRLGADV